MQKILNDPEPFVDEMLDGILAAHPDRLRRQRGRCWRSRHGEHGRKALVFAAAAAWQSERA